MISSRILERYGKKPLSFEELREVADGPFDLFLIPLIFEEDFRRDRNVVFNEARRQEIRDHALEIARKYGYDVEPPELIPGVERSLLVLLSGTSSYIRAGNNMERCRVGENELEVFTVALSTQYSYKDEETLLSARPKAWIHDLEELLPKLAEQRVA